MFLFSYQCICFQNKKKDLKKHRAIYTALSLFSCSVLKISLSQKWSSGVLREVLHPVFLYLVEKEYCCRIFLTGLYSFYLIGQNTSKDEVETCSGRCHCIVLQVMGGGGGNVISQSLQFSPLLSWTNNCCSQTKG